MLLLGEVPERLEERLRRERLEIERAPAWPAGPPAGQDRPPRAGLAEFEVLVTASHVTVDAEHLREMPALRIVARCAAGTDNVDAAALRSRGIPLLHAPEANAQSAAELTMGLLFAVARQIPYHDRKMREGTWSRGLKMGLELEGKRLAVVGLGRIGGRVARMARAIPMRVSGYDPYVPLERFTECGVRRCETLEPLLDDADVLSVHCPLNAETRGMIGESELARLPRGAVVLNVARGGIVDEKALAARLSSGVVRAAGIDCWEEEPPTAGNPLLRPQNLDVVATPHIGARTAEARDRVADETADALLARLRELGLMG